MLPPFSSQGFSTSMYASSWFVTLFASTLSLNVVYRIMDAFLVDVSVPRPAVYPIYKHLSDWQHMFAIIPPLPVNTNDVMVVPFFLQGLPVVFRVGLALLHCSCGDMVQMDIEEMLKVLHCIRT